MERILEVEAMDTAEEAVAYDEMDHSEANAAFLTRLLELGVDGATLDIGVGPGHLPLLLCAACPAVSVIGIDLSKHMLAAAERHRSPSPFADRIEYRLADAKGLPFSTGQFDAVYSNTILHHIPAPLPFLTEARRVLKPGGCLLIRDLFRPTSPQAADALAMLHAGQATEYQRQLFRDSLGAAFTPAELRALADEAGLGDAELVIDTDRHMSLQLRAN
ncbi:MAG: class I SAM-dependent methyltransferase [Planctomycetota bacterium]|jgi:ubiquinone/menaquinone biosynthesis C-methylase UbiE|nr:SAM-dependent methyltransferase [Planctomycetota bacterium]MDP6518972.1 class I SAM-dependent methyltransferase [Planctomycetota bacterium]MDP6839939.1 class I SAM-dependent methyltransferase [Planctomycetota bacterium]